MAKKEVKELSKTEGARPLPLFWDPEQWFEDFFRRPLSSFNFPRVTLPAAQEIVPTVDIFEENGDVVVKAEMPGIKKEDIEVTMTEDTITLSGEKKKEEEVKKKDYYRWECSYGSFCRTFSLPAEVQPNKVKSKLKDGILEIRVPKTEEAKKKEVKVKVE